jgi:formylglycine-generating enzyme required for sulfatase activity
MRTEVTNAQYARCVTAGACTAPANTFWNDSSHSEHPVVNVDWKQASAYAKWAGGRLPTEAEWEKACRGTDGRIYPWGNQAPTSILANFIGSGTELVGSHPAGTSPYGALNMPGNVYEWTSSHYQPYPYNANDGRESQEASIPRTMRGGSFFDLVNGVRCAGRKLNYSFNWNYDLGFRVMSPGS